MEYPVVDKRGAYKGCSSVWVTSGTERVGEGPVETRACFAESAEKSKTWQENQGSGAWGLGPGRNSLVGE